MTDLSYADRKTKRIKDDINRHDRTRCGRHSWYVKAKKDNNRIYGLCTLCGRVVEEYVY